MTDETKDVPMPSRRLVEAALASQDDDRTTDAWNEIDEAARFALYAIPKEADFDAFCLRNPINQVYFRAGLLACREYMARFVEQSGNPEIAQSIRANWWPNLGPDPGPPRLFDFAEIAEEHEGPNGEYSVTSKDISPSVEALPRAHAFLQSPVMAGDPAEPRRD
jgi:hypothetical protein